MIKKRLMDRKINVYTIHAWFILKIFGQNAEHISFYSISKNLYLYQIQNFPSFFLLTSTMKPATNKIQNIFIIWLLTWRKQRAHEASVATITAMIIKINEVLNL